MTRSDKVVTAVGVVCLLGIWSLLAGQFFNEETKTKNKFTSPAISVAELGTWTGIISSVPTGGGAYVVAHAAQTKQLESKSILVDDEGRVIPSLKMDAQGRVVCAP